jgi:hypothetical protein
MNKTLRTRIAIAVAILILAYLGGIRVAHPHSGLKNSLGSAESGLVIYKTGSNFAKGSKVIVKTQESSNSPVLAFVIAVNKDSYDIQSDASIVRVEKNQAQGKLLLMVPFLGSFFGLIGL